MINKSKRGTKEVPQEQVNVQFPVGILNRIDGMLRKYHNWINRQDFIREAVKEKLDRIEESEIIK